MKLMNNDKWHGILAVVVISIIFWLLWSYAPMEQSLMKYILAQIIAISIAHYMQCWNEINQALDPYVIAKYRSWRNFQENSRRDFHYFWIGVLISHFVTGFMAIWL